MNRNDAKKIAEIISNQELQEMFNAAKLNINDWTVTSYVDKGMTKGTAWNVLAKNFDPNVKHHILAKINMIREFGEFLPVSLKPIKKKKENLKQPPVHQDPQF